MGAASETAKKGAQKTPDVINVEVINPITNNGRGSTRNRTLKPTKKMLPELNGSNSAVRQAVNQRQTNTHKTIIPSVNQRRHRFKQKHIEEEDDQQEQLDLEAAVTARDYELMRARILRKQREEIRNELSRSKKDELDRSRAKVIAEGVLGRQLIPTASRSYGMELQLESKALPIRVDQIPAKVMDMRI